MIPSTASLFATVLIVAASAVGWAVLMGSLAVLYAMDLRHHRWLPAAGWVATAFAGGWLAVVPGVSSEPPPWPVVVLSLTLALLIWRDIDRWPRLATITRRDYLFGV